MIPKVHKEAYGCTEGTKVIQNILSNTRAVYTEPSRVYQGTMSAPRQSKHIPMGGRVHETHKGTQGVNKVFSSSILSDNYIL